MLPSLPSSEPPPDDAADLARRLRDDVLRLGFRLVADLTVLKAESDVGRVRGYGWVKGNLLDIDALGGGDGDEGSMLADRPLIYSSRSFRGPLDLMIKYEKRGLKMAACLHGRSSVPALRDLETRSKSWRKDRQTNYL